MKPTSSIDRATLIKGTGTAALAALLAGALEGNADACCSPIDLMYTDDPVAAQQATRKPHAQPITGIRLWSPHGTQPAPGAPWKLLYTIANAHANGNDEHGKPHGTNGKPTPLGYTISVYVMMS